VSGRLEDVRGGRRIDPARHGYSDFKALPEAPAESVIFRQGICCACLRFVVQTGEDVAKEPSLLALLVVDDDPSIRRMIVAALKRDGYVFHEAPKGRKRSTHAARAPERVVLDLMMPVLSGWDVLQARGARADLKKNPGHHHQRQSRARGGHGSRQRHLRLPAQAVHIGALSALVRSCFHWTAGAYPRPSPRERGKKRPSAEPCYIHAMWVCIIIAAIRCRGHDASVRGTG